MAKFKEHDVVRATVPMPMRGEPVGTVVDVYPSPGGGMTLYEVEFADCDVITMREEYLEAVSDD